MNGKRDRKLESKEGKTMPHLYKNLHPSISIKASFYADIFTGFPKSGNIPNQHKEMNQTSYIHIGRGGEEN